MFTKEAEGDEFGPTYDLHSALMAVTWGPGINLAIIAALYSYRKYYTYAHVIYGFFITIYSIGTALPILLTTGILSNNQGKGKDLISGSTIYAHYIVGISSLSVVLLQALLGIGANIMNYNNFSSASIIVIKYIHRVFGYLVAILFKSNVYIIFGPNDGSFWLFLVQDLVFAIIIIARKIVFPKMKNKGVPEDFR
jgi:hypothetical protein